MTSPWLQRRFLTFCSWPFCAFRFIITALLYCQMYAAVLQGSEKVSSLHFTCMHYFWLVISHAFAPMLLLWCFGVSTLLLRLWYYSLIWKSKWWFAIKTNPRLRFYSSHTVEVLTQEFISYLGGAWWSALAENTVKQTRASNLLL